ncbi:MAG TPA: hypothetical protein VGR85_12515 [Candidatus Limnocylindria bacterium]|nr:hypothetical protein [Candidatus Limnocylindria bacterium]
MEGLIHFLCVLPAHVRDPQLDSDHITVFDGQWAFCAGEVHDEKHDWQKTGGVSRAEVAKLLAERRSSSG